MQDIQSLNSAARARALGLCFNSVAQMQRASHPARLTWNHCIEIAMIKYSSTEEPEDQKIMLCVA
jgi:hypothetical protein